VGGGEPVNVILDMQEAEYHAHSALSSTNARLLLDSPAKYRYAQTHPEAPKAIYDVGSAVHSAVLGVGAKTVIIPEEHLAANGAISTTAAKKFVEEARFNGLIPVKRDVHLEIEAMKESVLAHPTARILFEQVGNPEVSVFGTDPETEIRCRARFDYLPSQRAEKGQTVAVDLKSADDASPSGFSRAAATHGYHVQYGHYDDTNRFGGAIEIDGFAFVVVEKHAPYLVGVYRLNSVWEQIGIDEARRARRIFRECLDTDTWPGYGDEIQSLMAPFWLISEAAEASLV